MSDRENNGEDELSLPKTTVHKLITEMLPSDIACSKETREILIECCVEFIHLLASEANDVCEKESKKTIAAEHVISALQSLGFDEYIPHIQAVYHDHKNTMKIRDRKSSRLENSGLTQEELLKNQEELFAKARQRYQTQSSSSAPGLESPPLSSNASFTPFSFPPPPS